MAYLSSLPKTGALLLFVAPAKRIETLWPELSKRCLAAGQSMAPGKAVSHESRTAVLGKHHLGLVSWRVLLAALGGSVEMAGDMETAGDIRQLIELCESMDTEAFLPLTAEELTSNFGRRAIQFGELADDLTDLLVAKGYASANGLRATGANGWYGRYLLLKGHGSFLHFNSQRWANRGHSPLWLKVKGPEWEVSDAVRNALARGEVTFFDSDDGCYVPVPLAMGAEREEVL